MKQKWQNLFYLHWEVDPAYFNNRLPNGISLDTYQGHAHIAVVGLQMSHIRPNAFPNNFNLFNLTELNLRTNVRGPSGTRGVLFFSLETNHTLANLVARTFFKLPYNFSQLHYHYADTTGHFRGTKSPAHSFQFHFKTLPQTHRLATHNPLEDYLLERYTYFTPHNNQILSGTLTHEPYTLSDIDIELSASDFFKAHNFDPPATPPSHACFVNQLNIKTL